jgi:hypothetical protein
LKSVASAGTQPCFCLAHFPVRRASIGFARRTRAVGRWRLRSCYSPPSQTSRGTEESGASLGCWRNGFKRPVLKHGPRSATCSRVFGWKTRTRNESESRYPFCGGHRRPSLMFSDGLAVERVRCDPKDGELFLRRAKPEETLVEARSGSDVQIDRRTWV